MKKTIVFLLTIFLMFGIFTASVSAAKPQLPVFTLTDDSVLMLELWLDDPWSPNARSITYDVPASDKLGYTELVLPYGIENGDIKDVDVKADYINFNISPDMLEAYGLDKTKLEDYYKDLRDTYYAHPYVAVEGEDTYNSYLPITSEKPLIGTGFTMVYGKYRYEWETDYIESRNGQGKVSVLIQQETKFAFRIVTADKPGERLKDVNIKKSSTDILSLPIATSPEHVKEIKLDNKVLNKEQYLLAMYGRYLQIDPNLINNLSVGDHSLTVLFKDNTSKTITLSVKEESVSSEKDTTSKKPSGENNSATSPKTGNEINVVLALILVISGAATILVGARKIKA